ncbi:DUF4280 domain-containing protein [Pedobacter petrophilus]|uniref:DUF4280 domain-containing protein n=1 Tax=Pedobacter petrophilus TaxID=1908241 RepID=A0A7K0G099_9SPHI|nr:DUF4280 domain-containing protein [Pedobacter petrophilus]MRX77131.1 DUF4280 domain-containing protein [Pedobacter petrophilus]
MAKKYVPNGAYLVCDKGLGYGKLKVTNHKNVRLYGKQMATEGDKVPMVNIPCLGICSITKTKCQPIPLLWQGVQQGITIGPYRKLLEDSKLPCSLGGKIGIHFSMPAALATIEANVTAMRQREMKSLGAKVDDWFQKGFDEQEKANNKIGGLYGKYANFKLGVNEGIYGGVKGIGEGLVFLKEMGDKATGAALHAVTHPTETAGKVKDAAVATKNAVSGAANWVSTPGNVKKVVSDVRQAHVNAYNWATTPGNLESAGKAALNKTGEGLKQAKDWASKQSPRDWGRYTGRTGFEVGLMFTGVGEAKAVVSGAEGANVLAKTAEGANVLAKTSEAARVAKIAKEANATAKALEVAEAAEKAKKARTLGEVVSEGADDLAETTFRDKNGVLRKKNGQFAKDPKTVAFKRSISERKKALIRDAKDPNSGLSDKARKEILQSKGDNVPKGHEVDHTEPLYTGRSIAEKQALDKEYNMKTMRKSEHKKLHTRCNKVKFHKYPPENYR